MATKTAKKVIGNRFNDEATITVTTAKNPKRKGTKAFAKFEAVRRHNGKSVAALRENWSKLNLPDSAGAELKWCLAHKFVEVSMAA